MAIWCGIVSEWMECLACNVKSKGSRLHSVGKGIEQVLHSVGKGIEQVLHSVQWLTAIDGPLPKAHL